MAAYHHSATGQSRTSATLDARQHPREKALWLKAMGQFFARVGATQQAGEYLRAAYALLERLDITYEGQCVAAME